jgi:hypothetical protein
MKKSIFILSLVLVYHTAFAQKLNFGLRAGLTSAQLVENVNGATGNTASITNVDIAAYLDFKYGNFTIQPGVGYFLKGGGGDGGSFSTGSVAYLSNVVLTLHYLEIPVNLIYNFPVKYGKFFVGAGPYVAYALSGNNEVLNIIVPTSSGSTGSQSNTANYPVSFGSGIGDLHRVDFGVNTLGGFRFKNGLELGFAFSPGLTNLVNASNVSTKNVTASFTVGYFFK